MPYCRIFTAAGLDEWQKEEIRKRLFQLIDRMPGRSSLHCMAHIEGGQSMIMGDGGEKCAYAEIRLFGKAAQKDKEALAAGLTQVICEIAGAEKDRVYMNLFEMDEIIGGGVIHRKTD
jgi:phenylpyruvate tautomerase PptA (4-oxalocrotonate tautomerase family)